MPALTLHYFEIPGRAETIRLVLHIGGVDHKVWHPQLQAHIATSKLVLSRCRCPCRSTDLHSRSGLRSSPRRPSARFLCLKSTGKSSPSRRQLVCTNGSKACPCAVAYPCLLTFTTSITHCSVLCRKAGWHLPIRSLGGCPGRPGILPDRGCRCGKLLPEPP